MPSTFTAAQYSGAMRALLPRGRVWSIEDGSVQSLLCDGLTKSVAQVDNAANQLLSDAFPATAGALLPEWNLSVGIPDACFGTPQTQAQNIQQLLSKIASSGGQSVPYFVQLAAIFGINITISEFSATHTAPDAPAGMIVNAQDWNYTFRVNIDRSNMSAMTVASKVDSYLSNRQLQAVGCLLTRYKPAHTQFYYGFFTNTPSRNFNVADTANQHLTINL